MKTAQDVIAATFERRVAYCSTCRAERTSSPRSTNHCGTCGTFLRGHVASTKAPPDHHRRRQLADDFFRQYEPDTELLRTLAVALERFEKEVEPNRRKSRQGEIDWLTEKLESARAIRKAEATGHFVPSRITIYALPDNGRGGELERYRRGEVSRLNAIRMTAAWVQAEP